MPGDPARPAAEYLRCDDRIAYAECRATRPFRPGREVVSRGGQDMGDGAAAVGVTSDPEDRRRRLQSLLAELAALDLERDAERGRELLAEGAQYLDRMAEPRRWAALRNRYAALSEKIDPPAAAAAYRDALEVWDPASERDSWLACHEGIGWLLARQAPLTPAQQQEAIEHLECAVGERPYLAAILAPLYQFHTLGDPWANWHKRVAYLEQGAALIERESEPERWAAAMNALAVACQEEPDADFGAALERRLARHAQVLAALPAAATGARVETWLALSECFRFRCLGDAAANLATAESYARDALAACPPAAGWRLRAEALLALARVLLRPGRSDAAALAEARALCDEAAPLIDPALSPALRATVESFRSDICLEGIAAGDLAQVEPLLAHGQAALALLSAPEALRDRRVVRQVIADGLLLAGRFEQAAATLRDALADATTALAEASSIAGRMERIWEFRDSAALLAHCLLRLGRDDEALLALDRGKALFWRTDDRDWTRADLAGLVPAGGALLCANFAADPGAVTIVAAGGSETVWLPHFGRQRLLQLQRGDAHATALGGWLLAYHQQHAEAAAWRQMIDEAGRVLFDELWQPLLQRLPALGVAADGELLWLHQGGSSVFPLHAAWYADDRGERHWLLDEHVIRYAPSIRALLAARPENDGRASALLVADPLRDLPFATVECAWVQQALATPATLLGNDEATPAAVVAALGRVDILHLATHARFDLERPLQSCVFLAGGERLTIESLLPALAGRPPALLALSACETAMARVASTPDESLGFPAAFLHAGTRSVLASLWPVDDVASAFLVGRFYRELAGGAKPPACALRDAQRWLRTVSVAELMALLRAAKELPPPAGPLAAATRSALRSHAADHRPYAAPWFWAAFIICGRE
jgi:CHAT domain-containing protein